MTKDDYVALVHKLPCVACYLLVPREVWAITIGKVHAHHLESVRHALSDFGVVPLCPMHHQGSGGVHRLSRREFAMRYKLDDVKMLEGTIKLVIQLLTHKGLGPVSFR